ncbi:MAG: hypothetical protein OXH75_16400 [Acidobacteria bacterium]|nr:hypothetical protein [Acidobacteriota bacterium]
MVEIAASSLALRAAKIAYDLWKENRSDAAVDLTDDARAVLKTMQSDATMNGVFAESTPIACKGLRFVALYQSGLGMEMSYRVLAELQAKGLVESHTAREGTNGHEELTGIKLTHLGWILNPETGKADKVG